MSRVIRARKLSRVEALAEVERLDAENLRLNWALQDALAGAWEFQETVRIAADETMTLRLSRSTSPHGGLVMIEHNIRNQSPWIVVRYLETSDLLKDIHHAAWQAFERLKRTAWQIQNPAKEAV